MTSLYSSPVSTSPTRNQSVVEKLVQQIKEHILRNDLKVGDHLPSERELGEKYFAARNTVREAVRILKAYGVIDVRPKVGAVIVNRHMDAVLDLFSFQLTISRETFLDIQGFRNLVEVGSVDAILKKITNVDLDELKRVNSTILTATSAVEAAERDFEFHSALLGTAGNKTVLDVYKTMKPIITKLMETGKDTNGVQGTYDAHATIMDTLTEHDRLGFQYLMTRHLQHGLTYIDQSVKANIM